MSDASFQSDMDMGEVDVPDEEEKLGKVVKADNQAPAIDGKRERAFRQWCMQTVSEKYVLSNDWIVLLSDAEQWFQWRENKWQEIQSKEFDGIIGEDLRKCFEDNCPAQGRREHWQLKRGDVGETVFLVKSKVQPEGWSKVSERDRQKPFHLVTGEVFDGIAFKNRVVWIDDDNLLQRKKITRDIFVRSASDYDWDELYEEDEDSDAPENFSNWVGWMLEDDGVCQSFVRMLGALMCGHLPKLQVAPLLIGQAGTGKGTTIRLIEALVGEESVVSHRSPIQVGGRFAMSGLRGKTVLSVADLANRPRGGSSQATFDDGLGTIKNLVGGDAVDIEVKNGGVTSQRLPIAVVMATNFAPRWISGAEDSGAWDRRLIPFEFVNIPEKREDNFFEKVLLPEVPHIAVFCILEYVNWRSENTKVSGTDLRGEQQELFMRAVIRNSKSDAAKFVDDRIIEGDGLSVHRKALRQAFQEFMGVDIDNRKAETLYREIAAAFPNAEDRMLSISGKRERGFDGIGITIEEDDVFI